MMVTVSVAATVVTNQEALSDGVAKGLKRSDNTFLHL